MIEYVDENKDNVLSVADGAVDSSSDRSVIIFRTGDTAIERQFAARPPERK